MCILVLGHLLWMGLYFVTRHVTSVYHMTYGVLMLV